MLVGACQPGGLATWEQMAQHCLSDATPGRDVRYDSGCEIYATRRETPQPLNRSGVSGDSFC